MLYHDRIDAGHQLGQIIKDRQPSDPFVLGLPRGGVVVGFEVSQILGAPLDVLVARKLGAPFNPEFGFGAIAPGAVYLDPYTVKYLDISDSEINEIIAREREELDRRVRVYREAEPEPDLAGRTALIVDDGLATGVTARAAILSVRLRRPARIILAVPVAPPETGPIFRVLVDDFICPAFRADFHALSLWYENFEQVTDEQVSALLHKNKELHHLEI